MPTMNEAFPSKYISAADLNDRDVTVKITHVTADEIDGKQKFICYFAGGKKGLVLNKTNFKSIVRITGYDNTDDWTGAEVTLYPTMVDYQGDQVAAIRIKGPKVVARPSSAEMGRDDFPGDRKTKPAKEELNDEIGF